MIKLIHYFLQFIWSNILILVVWAWVFWITSSQIDIIERLYKVENNARDILEWILTKEKASRESSEQSLEDKPDTVEIRSYGNSDGWI